MELIHAFGPSPPGQPQSHLFRPGPAHLREERESWKSQGGTQVWSVPGEWRPCVLLRATPGSEGCTVQHNGLSWGTVLPGGIDRLDVRMKRSDRQTLTGTRKAGDKGAERPARQERAAKTEDQTQDRRLQRQAARVQAEFLPWGRVTRTSSKGAASGGKLLLRGEGPPLPASGL